VAAGLTALPLLAVMYPQEFYLSNRGDDRERVQQAKKLIAEIKDTVPEGSAVFSSFLAGFYPEYHIPVVQTMSLEKPEDIETLVRAYRLRFTALDEEMDAKIRALLQTPGSRLTLREIARNGPFIFSGIEPSR
jgi:hypothetical protein